MKVDIYKDSKSYVTDEVSTVPTKEANLNETNRRKFVTDLAAISRGKYEAKHFESRYNALCLEAAPQELQLKQHKRLPAKISDRRIKGSPSRPLEFLPVVVIVEQIETVIKVCGKLFELDEFTNAFGGSLGYLSREGVIIQIEPYYYLYTNMRSLLNAGIPYEDIPYNESVDLENFVAIRANVPMFVWAQVPNTHTMISKEAQSDRVATNDDYWLPSDFRSKVFTYRENHKKNNDNSNKAIFNKIIDEVLGCKDIDQIPSLLLSGRNATRFYPTTMDIVDFFKEIGYKKEIYQRVMYYLKYKEVVMTGWSNNPKVWNHLFNERNANTDIWKNWTQQETAKFVLAIKDIVTK